MMELSISSEPSLLNDEASTANVNVGFSDEDVTEQVIFSNVVTFNFSIDLAEPLRPGLYSNPALNSVQYSVSGTLASGTPSGFPSFNLERTISGTEFYAQGSSLIFEILPTANFSDGLQVSELAGTDAVFVFNGREQDTGRYHPALLELNGDGTGLLRNSNNSGGVNPSSLDVVDVEVGEEYITELFFDPNELTIATASTLQVTDVFTRVGGFAIQFNEAIALQTLNLYAGKDAITNELDTGGLDLNGPDISVIGSEGSVRGSLVLADGGQRLDFIPTGASPLAGDYSLAIAGQSDGVIGLNPTQVASGLERPLFVSAPPEDTERLFILEQTGRIEILNLSTGLINPEPFLTVNGLSSGGEQGLLGLAFHPDYETNGLFYVNFTDESGTTNVRRYQVSESNPDLADPESAQTVLRIEQPQANHNGGWMGFGPNDGLLYISSGDGGGGNDSGSGHTPEVGNAQDITDNLLGKILRIDINGDDFSDPERNYAIPTSNPFVGVEGDDEIWAYGLRNAWRASFDRETGDLYFGDVGQSNREEINVQPATSNGGENYGWRLREGTVATPSSGIGGDKPTDAVDPIYDYLHGSGNTEGNSVTGGYVYRGPIEQLQGHYFFGDFVNNRIWSLKFDNSDPSGFDGSNFTQFMDWTETFIPDQGSINGIASFGEDGMGNLYIVSLDGTVFRLDERLLDGNGDGISDDDFQEVVNVIADDPDAPRLRLPDFSVGPGQDVTLSPMGLPVYLDNGEGVNKLEAVLNYDANLLEVRAIAPESLPDGWTATDFVVGDGEASFVLEREDGFTTPLVSFGLTARVPEDAPYGRTTVLEFGDLGINDSSAIALTDPAIQQVAFLGDTNGSQDYSLTDAQLLAQVVVGLASGFSAYSTTDPRILGDVSGNGELSGLDAALIARQAAGEL